VNRIIREYQIDDTDQILTCWESATRLAHPFLTEEFLNQERYNIPNLYLPNAETWVIEDQAEVIGFIALLGNEVGAIFVKPDFHGTGAGKALMDKARELRGDLEVEVFEANSIGRKFYQRYGFMPLSESTHEATGKRLLRLKYQADQSAPVS